MPRTIKLAEYAESSAYRSPDTYEFGDLQVATEEELLEFANAVREAGGASPIEALIPSAPSVSNQCLIANALNFQSKVDIINEWSVSEEYWDRIKPKNFREHTWGMLVESDELAEKIQLSVEGTSIVKPKYEEMYFSAYVVLPAHIGNAAHAFDHGQAFQEFVGD